MPIEKNNNMVSANILVIGHIQSAIKTLTALRDAGVDCDLRDRFSQHEQHCSILWVCLDDLSKNIFSLDGVHPQRIIIHLSCRPTLRHHTLIQDIRSLAEYENVAQIDYCAQDSIILEELKHHIALNQLCTSPVYLPSSTPSSHVPSEKIQIGIFLPHQPDVQVHNLLSRLQTLGIRHVRIWEQSPAVEGTYNSYPSSWSIYRPGDFAFERFANLVDALIFTGSPDNPHYIVEAARQDCVIFANSQQVAQEAAPLLHADIQTKEGEAILRSLNPANCAELTKENRRYIQHHFSNQAFHRTIQSELLIQTSHTTKVVQTSPTTPVLFISTNGIGLGHITRLLAVAKRCPDNIQPVFAVFSAGVRLVKEAGYICEHMVSNEFAETSPAGWHDHTHTELSAIIRYYQPRAVIYDGNVLYPGVIRATSKMNLPFLWVRRGLFRKSAPMGSLANQIYADILFEPGEFAHEYEKGPTADRTAQVHWPRHYQPVPPITLLSPCEVLSREEAQQDLGFNDKESHILIQVGAGNLRDTDRLIENLVGILNSKTQANIYVAQWPISDRPPLPQPGLKIVKKYPLSQHLNAFDFVISATGYNSFHELMVLGIPAILIPNEFTRLDDQVARAQFASDFGAALLAFAEDTDSIEQAITQILNAETRAQLKKQSSKLKWDDGAQEIADWINKIIMPEVAPYD